ncbi:Integrase [Anopheles sinensis]|uniref:Integrase n=1 Tax=Anopheles sinensis TaxID=74873 RepID=A0A084WD66_ANOSI|nr:Integrase [Anopheles sinensis]
MGVLFSVASGEEHLVRGRTHAPIRTQRPQDRCERAKERAHGGRESPNAAVYRYLPEDARKGRAGFAEKRRTRRLLTVARLASSIRAESVAGSSVGCKQDGRATSWPSFRWGGSARQHFLLADPWTAGFLLPEADPEAAALVLSRGMFRVP